MLGVEFNLVFGVYIPHSREYRIQKERNVDVRSCFVCIGVERDERGIELNREREIS